ncbi:MAG: hypothetical protein ABFC84_00155 [Veillonellales bacterium]
MKNSLKQCRPKFSFKKPGRSSASVYYNAFSEGIATIGQRYKKIRPAQYPIELKRQPYFS